MKGTHATATAEPLRRALAEGVYGTYHALQRAVSAVLTELPLTESLADAVWQLDPAEGPQPRRVPAERLHRDPSNVTILVDKLVLRGLVERSQGATGPWHQSLTSTGVAVRNRLIAATAEAPAFAGLGPEEQRQLAELPGRCSSQRGTGRRALSFVRGLTQNQPATRRQAQPPRADPVPQCRPRT